MHNLLEDTHPCKNMATPQGEGVLSTIPIQVCAAPRSRDSGIPHLERIIEKFPLTG